MKKKFWGKYLIYLIVVIILYSIGSMILTKHYNEAEKTFIYNYWLITLVKITFFGGIGAVLGFDGFLKELNCKGKWKFDIAKLIILGIPSLMFSLPYLIITFIPLSNQFSNIFTISSVVLGYTLMSIPYKDNLID